MEFEKDIETHLKKEVEKLVGLCIKVSPEHTKGIPDRLVVLPPDGRTIWVELKRAKDGRLSDLQKYQHDKLRKLGAQVEVLWTKAEVDDFIRKEAERC